MYNGTWYNSIAFLGDLHVETVDRLTVRAGLSLPVSFFPAASVMPPHIGSPVNIAKGSRL